MPTIPATDNLVEVENVNFAYDSRQILKGVNLNIRRGQVVAIMGLSGCGKTTTLRLIGGQLKATAGSVEVDGQRVDALRLELATKLVVRASTAPPR